MRLYSFEGGYDKNFTYMVAHQESVKTAIVDPALPVHELSQTIRRDNLAPSVLLITHTHYDHVVYVNEYLKAYPHLKVYLFSKKDRYRNQINILNRDKISVGSLCFFVIHTPGHTLDSVCYLVGGVLFSGDTLFVGRTGRTIGIDSDPRQLYRSIYSKILTLPENTMIYPGHNYGEVPYITIKENIKISPLLRATDEEDFLNRMEAYEQSRKVKKN